MEIDSIIKKEAGFDKTIGLRNLLRKKVLSKGGKVVGSICEIRISPRNGSLEGVVVSRGPFKKVLYIGKGYFSHLSNDSVILNIEPSLLLMSSLVVTFEGKVIGRVCEVSRKGESNEIDFITARKLFSKFTISNSGIKSIGKSVILRQGYRVTKKPFWKKSE